MTSDFLIPLIRFSTLALLYVFIALLLVVVLRDLKVSVSTSIKTVLGHLLVLERGNASLVPGEPIELTSQNSLGRSKENDIFIDDATVSAKHALISYRHNRWWLKDLGSTNGTFVNEKQIQGLVEIFDGDVIAAGRVQLKLRA